MVDVGAWCVDTKEASVFGNAAGTGPQFGTASDDYPAACNDNGNGCSGIFARSQAGVPPSRFITWFQAHQACDNVGKQLVPNDIWLAAAAGTPDNAVDCNISSTAVVNTGARTGCVSRWGAMDMVGNVDELVADWMQGNGFDKTSDAGAGFGNDGVFGVRLPTASSPTDPFPAALFRGGVFDSADEAGVFTLDARFGLQDTFPVSGFRCGRFK